MELYLNSYYYNLKETLLLLIDLFHGAKKKEPS